MRFFIKNIFSFLTFFIILGTIFLVADNIFAADLPIVINSNKKYTTSGLVNLYLDKSEVMADATLMRFSNDEEKWTGWKNYAEVWYRWGLHNSNYGGHSRQGRRKVCLQFRNDLGETSVTRCDWIVYDKISPSGWIKINNGSRYTKSGIVTLNLRSYDIGPRVKSGSWYMRFSNGNNKWTGWERYRKYRLKWGLNNARYGGNSKFGKKQVYVQFMDRAGNRSRKIRDVINFVYDPGGYVEIDLSSQKMVLHHGRGKISKYIISSGRSSMPTPTGRFRILSKYKNYWSQKYRLYMPYALRFHDGYFIHELPYWPGGYREGRWHLGIPVSHGCIRLGIGPAKKVYNFARIGTRVIIHR